MAFPSLIRGIEIAKLFEVAPSTITNWAKADRMPAATVINGRRYFDRETIRLWIVNGCLPRIEFEALQREATAASVQPDDEGKRPFGRPSALDASPGGAKRQEAVLAGL